jgi:CheY-like chemotaxis protein
MKTTQPASLLLVDDKPANLLSLEAILDGMGHQCVRAGSGEEALRLLLKQEFAVILLDVQMPGMDGFETARLIRGRESSHETPIIFLTAEVGTDEMVCKGYTLGAVDYLVKPLVPEILRAKVRVFVELGRKAEVEREARESAARLEQLEQELLSLSRLSEATPTSVTAHLYGESPLAHGLPEEFQALVTRYGELIDLALEQRAFKMEYRLSEDLRALGEQLGFLRAGPRDVVEIHSTALRKRAAGSVSAKAQAYVEEGRLAVLELMGYLAAYYRRYCSPSRPATRPSKPSPDEQGSVS